MTTTSIDISDPRAVPEPMSERGPAAEFEPGADAIGRAGLAAWLAAQPEDLFADDSDFKALVAHHAMDDRLTSLHAAGRAVAGPLDAAARTANLPRNAPVLDDWDGIGRYTATISHHPSHLEAGRVIYGTGVMAAFAESGVTGHLASPGQPQRPTSAAPLRFVLSLFHLTAQAGEAGHNCPLACDAGAIRTLAHLGTADQQAAYLPGLLDPNFDTNLTASQFLTEVQGGSDVGANAVRARPQSSTAQTSTAQSSTAQSSTAQSRATQSSSEQGDPDGAGSPWLISGEKWFCSNADADIFLITARVADPSTGTRGLGLFLIPSRLADGTPNGIRIRRLKDKLGTRSMASGEIDFTDARATALGPVRDGFRNVMDLVLTTSRLFNAAGCAAHARRAWVIASTYAQHRRAFGRPIAEFPLVAENLAWIRADATASLAATLLLAGLAERAEAGTITESEAAFFRIAVSLNKLETSVLSHDAVNRAIEVLGGNGAIESFSILPRLLRDNVVYENWEGSHNVLRAQVLRDCTRLGSHGGFFDTVSSLLAAGLDRDGAREGSEDLVAALAADRAELNSLLAAPTAQRDLRFRRLGHRMAIWAMIAAMAPIPELDPARAMTMRHLAELPVDDSYLASIAALQR